MKWEDLGRSSNVEDRRGQPGPRRSYGGGRGPRRSSGLSPGLLYFLLNSRGPLKWIVLGILAFSFISSALNSPSQDTVNQPPISQEAPASVGLDRQDHQEKVTDAEYDFLTAVLWSTEQAWTEILAQEGLDYQAPTLVVYSGSVATDGCGVGESIAGPFYCPVDQKVYIDLSFYRELATKYQAPGEFAMAYVLAHEVGHHVQNELGTMDAYHRQRQRLNKKQANALNVRLELQADYYAGVWAHYAQKAGILEVGDLEAALQAAHAVGDDTLQKEAYGYEVPDSFTHGTSQQRQEWFYRGFEYGDLAHGDTFSE